MLEKIYLKSLSLILFLAASFQMNAQEKDLSWYVKNAPFKMPAVTVPKFSEKTLHLPDVAILY